MNVEHTTVEGRKVEAHVVEGTIRDSLRRATIMREQLQQMKDTGTGAVMVIENLLRLNAYPSCVAATTELHDSKHPDWTIEELSFENFLDLPDQFLTKWTVKVFEFNPGWSDERVGPQVRPPSKAGKSSSS